MNIPNGHQAVMPYLMMDDAAKFIEFAKEVFNADLTFQSMREDDLIGHCEMQIGGSSRRLRLSRADKNPERISTRCSLLPAVIILTSSSRPSRPSNAWMSVILSVRSLAGNAKSRGIAYGNR